MMACRTLRVRRNSLSSSAVCIIAMKSSMYDSNSWKILTSLLLWTDVGIEFQSMFITVFLFLCGVMCKSSEKYDCARSLAVSVAAQKNAGLSDQPIWSALGITSWMSLSGVNVERT